MYKPTSGSRNSLNEDRDIKGSIINTWATVFTAGNRRMIYGP